MNARTFTLEERADLMARACFMEWSSHMLGYPTGNQLNNESVLVFLLGSPQLLGPELAQLDQVPANAPQMAVEMLERMHREDPHPATMAPKLQAWLQERRHLMPWIPSTPPPAPAAQDLGALIGDDSAAAQMILQGLQLVIPGLDAATLHGLSELIDKRLDEIEPICHCRQCGCTDLRACDTPEGPCSWAYVFQDGSGLCSACAGTKLILPGNGLVLP